jgi:maleylacetoacetate isomerase
MKLYTYFQSSASYRVRIALGLKGLKADMEYINLAEGRQRDAAYAAVNPEMIVPTLLDQGHTLSQSLAILEYLEEAYPAPPLLPSDRFDRAYVRGLCHTIAGDTAPLGNLKVRKYIKERGQNDDIIAAWMRHWIEEGLQSFEAVLARSARTGKFCYGNMPTMADCCLIPQAFNAIRWKCDLSATPLVHAVVQECEAHPAFIAAHPKNQKDAA